MSNAGVNAASGFQQGLGSVLDIANRIDQRKRTQTLAAQADQRFANEQTLFERGTQVHEQQQAERAEDRSFLQQQREYQQGQQEHEVSMRPFERQIKQMQVSGQYTQQQIREAQLRGVKREERNNEAKQIVMNANELLSTGNNEGFVQEFQKLKDYGYDVDNLIDPNAVTTKSFIGDVMEGNASLESPEAMEHIKRILGPSFNSSGRDGKQLELTGRLIRNPENGKFTIEMVNKETGKTAPATLGMGSDETQDPIVTELSQQELLDQAMAYSMLEEHAMKGALSVASVGAGGQSLLNRGQSMEDQETQANIEYKRAQTQKIMADISSNGADGKSGGGPSKKRMDDMIEAYDEEDPLSKAVLLNARNMPGFSIEDAPMDVSAIRLSAEQNDTSLAVATTAYYNAKVVAEQIPLHVEKYSALYPSVDPKKLEQAVTDLLNGGSQGAFDNRIEKLKGQSKRDEKYSEIRARQSALKEAEKEKLRNEVRNPTDMRGVVQSRIEASLVN